MVQEDESKPRVICCNGKTEQECRSLYMKGILCNQIYMIDTGADAAYSPDNCMYMQQYADWLIAEEIRRNPPEEDSL